MSVNFGREGRLRSGQAFDSALLCSGPSTRLRMLGGGRACPCRLALRRAQDWAYAHPSTSLHSALLRSASLRTNGRGSLRSGEAGPFDAAQDAGPSTPLRTGPSTRLRTGLTRILRLRCTPLRFVPLRSGRTVRGRFAQGKGGPFDYAQDARRGRTPGAFRFARGLRRGSGQALRLGSGQVCQLWGQNNRTGDRWPVILVA